MTELSSPGVQALPDIPSQPFAKKSVYIFSAAVFLFWMSLYLYVPTLPVYALTKTNDLALVGLMLAMYGFWQAVIRLPLGIVADWFGWHRWLMLIGLLLAAVSAWLMGSAAGIDELIVGRALSGFAAAAWVLMVAVFSSYFPPQEAVRASAWLTTANSIGRLAASALTGPLNDYGGYALPFHVAALAAVLSALALASVRTPPAVGVPPKLNRIVVLITRADVLLPALLNMLVHFINFSTIYSFVPPLATQMGAGNVYISIMVTINLAFYFLGNLLAGVLSKKIGSLRLLLISFPLLSLSTLGCSASPNLGVLLAVQVSLGLSVGLAYPVLMGLSIQQVERAERTTAMGMHQAVYAVGMFAGPWLSGILADAIGIRPMLAEIAVGAFLLAMIVIFCLRRNSKASFTT